MKILDSFWKNVITLSGGAVIAMGIAFVSQIVLRRVYEPADFGLYAVYASLISIFSVFGTGRYELAIVLPKEAKDGKQLVGLSLIILSCVCLLLSATLLFLEDTLIEYFKWPEPMHFWIHILPFSLFLTSFNTVINSWLVREKRFKQSALNNIVRRVAEAGAQGGLWFLFGGIGYLVGTIFGSLAQLASGLYQTVRQFSIKSITRSGMALVAKRFTDFPKYNIVPTLFNTLSLMLPLLLVNKFYGEEITGYFDLNRQIIAVPSVLVGTALGQVLLQSTAKSRADNLSITKELGQTVRFLLICGGAMLLVLIPFGPVIFSFIFGESYSVSGEYTRILVIADALKFVVSPLSILFTSLERLRLSAIWQMCYFVAIVGLFFLESLDIREFLLVYTIVDTVFYLFYGLLILHIVRKYEAQIA